MPALKFLKLIYPIIILIILIPFVQNDFVLAAIYFLTFIIYSYFYPLKNDWIVYMIGLVAMTFFEFIFISTGVETFNRNSLFGIMPLWLPFLWAFAFVILRRTIKLFE